MEAPRAGPGRLRTFGAAALALAGLVFSATPLAPRMDDLLLDREWRALRELAPRASPDEIIIVGIDGATVSSIAEPPQLWHASLGLALARISAAKPRAIGLDFPLPERGYEALRPGLDRALAVGLAAAIANGPFVATLAIDARTRSARQVHPPLLAMLGGERLGLGLFARDADGATRRFSLVVPTEDGGFPTLAGRLCRALSRACTDGLIDFGLGEPLRYVPMKQVLETRDEDFLAKLFRARIVLIGETQPFVDRIMVPINLAGWESDASDSPSVVVHAQALRTALAGAPIQASRPWTVVLTAAAALLLLVRDLRTMALVAAIAGAVLVGAAMLLLYRGTFLPVAAPTITLAAALVAGMISAWRGRGRVPNIQPRG